MNAITDEQIAAYVEAHIGTFHDKRLESLVNLNLTKLLAKNPYLFRSKNLVIAGDLVKSLLDAYLSSQEETLFGDFLEGLAIYVAEQVRRGWKSGITGIDLEFVQDGARYIISIKSGPNWGNSSQIKDMRDDFRTATRVIRQGNLNTRVVAVNGCCYGRDSRPDKGGYFKYCGQDFWELVSGDRNLYTRIIEPLGHNARQRNDDFTQRYGAVVNRFVQEFTEQFCDPNGAIDWDKLVRYSSAATPLLSLPAAKRAINRLPSVLNVCDALRQWGYPDLADSIELLSDNAGAASGNPLPDLGSLKGFLMVLGTVESDGNIGLTTTPEGLITAEWEFDDRRSATVTFLDVDRVRFDATGIAGEPIRIRNSEAGVARRAAVKRLVEGRLFVLRI